MEGGRTRREEKRRARMQAHSAGKQIVVLWEIRLASSVARKFNIRIDVRGACSRSTARLDSTRRTTDVSTAAPPISPARLLASPVSLVFYNFKNCTHRDFLESLLTAWSFPTPSQTVTTLRFLFAQTKPRSPNLPAAATLLSPSR